MVVTPIKNTQIVIGWIIQKTVITYRLKSYWGHQKSWYFCRTKGSALSESSLKIHEFSAGNPRDKMPLPDPKITVNRIIQRSNWEHNPNPRGIHQMGKEFFKNGDVSIFIANMDIHQPHGGSSNRAEYCVEILDENDTVRYWYYDVWEKAMRKVVELMKNH